MPYAEERPCSEYSDCTRTNSRDTLTRQVVVKWRGNLPQLPEPIVHDPWDRILEFIYFKREEFLLFISPVFVDQSLAHGIFPVRSPRQGTWKVPIMRGEIPS